MLPGRKAFSAANEQWVTDGHSPQPLHAFDETEASHDGIAAHEPVPAAPEFWAERPQRRLWYGEWRL